MYLYLAKYAHICQSLFLNKSIHTHIYIYICLHIGYHKENCRNFLENTAKKEGMNINMDKVIVFKSYEQVTLL
jgi:hypothetical protein